MTDRQTDLAAPRRVLIIKPSSLGDVVTAMPILRGLRRSFPAAHIAWLLSGSCAPLVAHDGDLNEVILFDRRRLGQAWRSPGAMWAIRRLGRTLREGRFDWVVDAQGLFRSGWFARASGAPVRAGFADARELAWLFYTHRVRPRAPHAVDRNIELARSLGADAGPRDMTLRVNKDAAAAVEQLLGQHGLKPKGFLLAAPPTRWPTKLYPARHWRTVLSALSGDLPVVLTGAQSEREIVAEACEGLDPASVIDLSGRTSVAQMVALIAASAGVLACDSSAKFIAPALGVDCVMLVGPTRLERSGPYLRGRALVADVPCQGCLKRRCGHVTCMQTIDPAAVIAAAREMARTGGADVSVSPTAD